MKLILGSMFLLLTLHASLAFTEKSASENNSILEISSVLPSGWRTAPVDEKMECLMNLGPPVVRLDFFDQKSNLITKLHFYKKDRKFEIERTLSYNSNYSAICMPTIYDDTYQYIILKTDCEESKDQKKIQILNRALQKYFVKFKKFESSKKLKYKKIICIQKENIKNFSVDENVRFLD